MSADEVRVVTDAMRSHAGQLEQLASSAFDGVRAGAGTLDGSAFGVLCSFIGAALAPVQATGVAATAASVGSIGATALQVRAVAAIYDEVDDVVATAMDRFRG